MRRYFSYFKEIALSFFLGNLSFKKFWCPYCKKNVFFISLGKDAYKNRCLNCGSSLISLSVIRAIKSLPPRAFNSTYELSFHGAVFDFLKKSSKNFTYSEFFPSSRLRFVGGVRNEDVQKLTFTSERFDLITSTEVFEHVPEYLKGFKEIYRVLKKNGTFCFTVPIFESAEPICKIGNKGKLIWLSDREYHGSRLTGNNSVPVFWHHSKKQILADLIKVGFKDPKALNYIWFNEINQIVFIARK
jgi:SAM-dependent methyltransferase